MLFITKPTFSPYCILIVETGSARMFSVTLNAGCQLTDEGAIGRQSYERLAILYYSHMSVCLCGCEGRFYFTTFHVRCANPRPRSLFLIPDRSVHLSELCDQLLDLTLIRRKLIQVLSF